MSNASFKSEATSQANGLRTWHPVPAIVIVILLFFGAQIMAAIVMAIARQSGLTFGPTIEQFLFVLLAETATLGILAALLRSRRQSFGSLGLTRPKLIDGLYIAGGFVAYFAFYALLLAAIVPLVPSLDVAQRQDVGFDTATGLIALIPVFITLVVLAPVTEEILVRGFLFGSLRARMSLVWAALVASLVFGAAHLFGGEQGAPLLWIAGIDTFVLSLVLCYLREKTGRLWAGIGLHALKNGIAFVALFILHVPR